METYPFPAPQQLTHVVTVVRYTDWRIPFIDIGSRRELFVDHHSGYPSNHVRRYTLRPDGFVSVCGLYEGGELVTRPFTFIGSRLTINYATSAVGGMYVEIQTPDGRPIVGFAMKDCPEIIGDHLEETVNWTSGADVSPLSGKPIRLRFRLKDADLFSLQFTGAN